MGRTQWTIGRHGSTMKDIRADLREFGEEGKYTPKGSLDPHSQGFDPHSQGFGPQTCSSWFGSRVASGQYTSI